MAMNTYNELIAALTERKTLYERMRTLALEAIRATGEPPAAQARADERATLIERLKATQEKITPLMEGPAGEELLERAEAATLTRQIGALIEETQAALARSETDVEAAMAEIQKELSSMGRGKKAITGYGQPTKEFYSRFIEKKG